LAARIHDIGKVGVPSEILTKPGRLTEAELALVRTHAELGGQLLRQVDFPERVQDIVRHHHERLDGSGYPDGLTGAELSIGTRIVAVADVAEAVASRRPYRAARGVHAAMQVLAEESGAHLDPAVVAVLVRLLDEGRIVLHDDEHDPSSPSSGLVVKRAPDVPCPGAPLVVSRPRVAAGASSSA
ncbi:MAG TPA: HD domain-containing phosphohydrolase, partial [Acidimicrobiales bacterium]|nr:HD domain-containing phosphohydrolase [Acidimicrobiales bacterium]